jgi:hypothetical protein
MNLALIPSLPIVVLCFFGFGTLETRAPSFHGVVLLGATKGPTGSGGAHVGERASTVITLINLDEFGDEIKLTNIYHTVFHPSGGSTSTNLIPDPVSLKPYETFEITDTFVVLDEDPDSLFTTAYCNGTDAYQGFPADFSLLVPTLLQVVRPCQEVTNVCVTIGERPAVTASFRNCGNGSLNEITLRAPTGKVGVGISRAERLDVGQTTPLTFTYQRGSAGPIRLEVTSTDQLGLSLTNYLDVDLPTIPPLLTATGQSNRVPLYVALDKPSTNVSLHLKVSGGHLEDPTLELLAPETASGFLTLITNNEYLLQFSTQNAQSLSGTQQVAWLNFFTVSNQPSRFIQVQLEQMDGLHADGTPLETCAAQKNRIVLIGQEPLLETRSEPSPTSILYAPKGSTNRVEVIADLSPSPLWALFGSVVATNSTVEFALPITNTAQFFRAVRE